MKHDMKTVSEENEDENLAESSPKYMSNNYPKENYNKTEEIKVSESIIENENEEELSDDTNNIKNGLDFPQNMESTNNNIVTNNFMQQLNMNDLKATVQEKELGLDQLHRNFELSNQENHKEKLDGPNIVDYSLGTNTKNENIRDETISKTFEPRKSHDKASNETPYGFETQSYIAKQPRREYTPNNNQNVRGFPVNEVQDDSYQIVESKSVSVIDTLPQTNSSQVDNKIASSPQNNKENNVQSHASTYPLRYEAKQNLDVVRNAPAQMNNIPANYLPHSFNNKVPIMNPRVRNIQNDIIKNAGDTDSNDDSEYEEPIYYGSAFTKQ